MTDHLSDAQIASYIERRGNADDILAIAQHLDRCWECRDRTAAMVDDGASDRPHEAGAHDRSRNGVAVRESWLRRLIRSLTP